MAVTGYWRDVNELPSVLPTFLDIFQWNSSKEIPVKYCVNGSEFSRKSALWKSHLTKVRQRVFFLCVYFPYLLYSSVENRYKAPAKKICWLSVCVWKCVQEKPTFIRGREGLIKLHLGVRRKTSWYLESKESLDRDTECAIFNVLHISLTSKTVCISIETSKWDGTGCKTWLTIMPTFDLRRIGNIRNERKIFVVKTERKKKNTFKTKLQKCKDH